MKSKKNNKKNVLLGAATMAAAMAAGSPVHAVTATIPINAIVDVSAIQITAAATGLNYGSISATDSLAATIQVRLDDTIVKSGNLNTVGGVISAGAFELKGASAKVYQITASSTIIVKNGGTFTMSVTGIEVGTTGTTSDPQPHDGTFPGLTGAGITTVTNLRVGGTLNLQNAQVGGTYTGTIGVTALYN